MGLGVSPSDSTLMPAPVPRTGRLQGSAALRGWAAACRFSEIHPLIPKRVNKKAAPLTRFVAFGKQPFVPFTAVPEPTTAL